MAFHLEFISYGPAHAGTSCSTKLHTKLCRLKFKYPGELMRILYILLLLRRAGGIILVRLIDGRKFLDKELA